MGIKLVLEKRAHMGNPDVTRPAIICDECGREIEAPPQARPTGPPGWLVAVQSVQNRGFGT